MALSEALLGREWVQDWVRRWTVGPYRSTQTQNWYASCPHSFEETECQHYPEGCSV